MATNELRPPRPPRRPPLTSTVSAPNIFYRSLDPTPAPLVYINGWHGIGKETVAECLTLLLGRPKSLLIDVRSVGWEAPAPPPSGDNVGGRSRRGSSSAAGAAAASRAEARYRGQQQQQHRSRRNSHHAGAGHQFHEHKHEDSRQRDHGPEYGHGHDHNAALLTPEHPRYFSFDADSDTFPFGPIPKSPSLLVSSPTPATTATAAPAPAPATAPPPVPALASATLAFTLSSPTSSTFSPPTSRSASFSSESTVSTGTSCSSCSSATVQPPGDQALTPSRVAPTFSSFLHLGGNDDDDDHRRDRPIYSPPISPTTVTATLTKGGSKPRISSSIMAPISAVTSPTTTAATKTAASITLPAPVPSVTPYHNNNNNNNNNNNTTKPLLAPTNPFTQTLQIPQQSSQSPLTPCSTQNLTALLALPHNRTRIAILPAYCPDTPSGRASIRVFEAAASRAGRPFVAVALRCEEEVYRARWERSRSVSVKGRGKRGGSSAVGSMSGSGSASVSASVSAGASGSGSVEGWRRGSITGITGAPAGYRERAGSGTMGSGVHGFDGGRHKDEVENRSGDGDVGTGTTDGSEHAGKRPASGTAAAAALVTPIRDQEHETKEAQGPRPLSMLPNSTQGASREVSSQGETTTHTKDEPLDEETTLWTEGHGPGLAMPGKTGLTVDVTRVPAFEAALRIVEHVRGLDNGRGC